MEEEQQEEYVFVDEDGPVIRVYTRNYDGPGLEVEGCTRKVRRQVAEIFAAEVADELGCGWGTNYF